MAQTVRNLQCGRPGFSLWVGKIPWRREWLPTPVFLPGEFHGQRSLVGHSPWGHKELDMAEQLSTAQPKNLLRAQRMESLIVKQNEGEFSLTIKYFLVDG